jgi:hypothetical protein
MRLVLACLMALTAATVTADGGGRIYGKIKTSDGNELKGIIRWDRNEVSWVDILNGTKEIRSEDIRSSDDTRHGRHRTSVKVFGILINDSDWDLEGDISAESAIRFGHVRTLIPRRGDNALLVLKSGDTVELSPGSTDFGSDMRELIIEDEREGETELEWNDIDEVEFLEAPPGAKSELGERFHGTLTTRRGDEFTGFVSWDTDECLTSDMLDGEERGRSRKIKLGRIASIERYSANGAQIKLTSGEDIVLKGTNDVDNSNRGIAVEDPNLGEVMVEWDEFDKLVLSSPAKVPQYADFNGGRPLHGAVETEDGDKYTGDIRWDQDEASTWEMLDGESRGARFRIEFGFVRKIERDSYRGSTVTLWDGRTFSLTGSNDVNDSNKGITIAQPGKKDVYVEWENFRSVEFTK